MTSVDFMSALTVLPGTIPMAPDRLGRYEGPKRTSVEIKGDIGKYTVVLDRQDAAGQAVSDAQHVRRHIKRQGGFSLFKRYDDALTRKRRRFRFSKIKKNGRYLGRLVILAATRQIWPFELTLTIVPLRRFIRLHSPVLFRNFTMVRL